MSPESHEAAPLTPGPDGTPVPGGLRVIRLANEPNLTHLSPEAIRRLEDGKALPSFFELSSEDKKQSPPRLSVWLEQLTTVAQAWVLVGANPKRRWVVFLEVDKVRAVSAPAVDKLPPTPPLEIEWERATQLVGGERVPDTREGWQGHAGITNLDQGNKTQREAIRWQLADLAVAQVLSEEDVASFIKPEDSATDRGTPTTPS